MGLDIHVLAKPKDGHTDEFEQLWQELNVANGLLKDPTEAKQGFFASLFSSPKAKGEQEIDRMTDRFREISISAYETIGAPVVGKDEAANKWLRNAIDDGDLSYASYEEALKELDGYFALQAMSDCDGFPLFTHAYMYEGPDRTSFRGKFLEVCTDVVGEDLVVQAWNPMLAEEFGMWADRLQACVEKYAKEKELETALSRSFDFVGDDGPADQVNIVADAARWAHFWSSRGHGAEPDF